MRSHWILVGLQANDWCPYKEREVWRQRQCCVTAEAETVQGKKEVFPGTLGAGPAGAWVSDFDGFQFITTRSERIL